MPDNSATSDESAGDVKERTCNKPADVPMPERPNLPKTGDGAMAAVFAATAVAIVCIVAAGRKVRKGQR